VARSHPSGTIQIERHPPERTRTSLLLPLACGCSSCCCCCLHSIGALAAAAVSTNAATKRVQYDVVLLPVVRNATTLFWACVAGVAGAGTLLMSFTDLGLAAILVTIVVMPVYQVIGGGLALVGAAATNSSPPARSAAVRAVGTLVLWSVAVGILPVIALGVLMGLK
jgi:hypothetical protein